MNIYIVVLGQDYEGCKVYSVWDCPKKAEQDADAIVSKYFGEQYIVQNRRKGCDYVNIVTHTLNEMATPFPHFSDK